MGDLFKKTLLVGVGLAAMTKEKIEELAKELTAKGEVSEKEGKELVDDLVKKAEETRKDLAEKVEGMVGKALEKMNVPTKSQLEALEERIRRLEEKQSVEPNPDVSE